MIEQPAQVGHATPQVVDGVPDVGDAKARGGGGDELHQPLGVLGGEGIGGKVGFGRDDGQDQLGVQAIVGGQALDQGDDVGGAELPRAGAVRLGVGCRGAGGGAGLRRGAEIGDAAGDHGGPEHAGGIGLQRQVCGFQALQLFIGPRVADGQGGLEPGGGENLVDLVEPTADIEPAQMVAGLGQPQVGGLAIAANGAVQVLGGADAMFVTLTRGHADPGVGGAVRGHGLVRGQGSGPGQAHGEARDQSRHQAEEREPDGLEAARGAAGRGHHASSISGKIRTA